MERLADLRLEVIVQIVELLAELGVELLVEARPQVATRALKLLAELAAELLADAIAAEASQLRAMVVVDPWMRQRLPRNETSTWDHERVSGRPELHSLGACKAG